MEIVEINVEQIVDLVKRADRADAIELIKSVVATARSAGVVEGRDCAWNGALASFDKIVASQACAAMRRNAG